MKIIINADDFGMSESINQAIFELANIGSLSSTTVMVNMPFWQASEELLNIKEFGIGLHFNLTEGSPINPISKVSSLVDPNGNFYNFKEFRNRSHKNLINKIEIKTELKAQIDLLFSIIGTRLTHIDSHQAIHKYKPVSDAIYEFKHPKLSLGLRSPSHFFISKNHKILKPTILKLREFGIKRILVELYYSFFQSKFSKKYKLPAGELLDISLKKTETLRKLEIIDINSKFILEIPCHPATSTVDLPPSKLTDKRIEEYEILKSERFKEILKKYELINFSKL